MKNILLLSITVGILIASIGLSMTLVDENTRLKQERVQYTEDLSLYQGALEEWERIARIFSHELEKRGMPIQEQIDLIRYPEIE